MAVNWSEPKIVKKEKNKIDPYELIAIAEKYVELGDYYSAERTYVAALKNAKEIDSQVDIVAKVRKEMCVVYDAWVRRCYDNKMFEETEKVLKRKLKVSTDTRAVKEDLYNLYVVWGDELELDGKLEGAETRYIRALQVNKELNDKTHNSSEMYKKVRGIENQYNTYNGKENARILCVLQEGMFYNGKATVLGVFGLICVFSSILCFFGNDVASIIVVEALAFLAPICIPIFSFNYERLQARGHSLIAFVYMFSWTAFAILFCETDNVWFFSAVAGLSGLYFSCVSVKMKALYRNKETIERVMNDLLSWANLEGKVDVTVTRTKEDENMEILKGSVVRIAGMVVRMLIESIFR